MEGLTLTLARDLSHSTLQRIVERFDLTEQTGSDGGAFIPLPGPMPGAGGECRIWSGKEIERMVYVGLAVPPANLDSHMLFAFPPTDGPLPHFTLDSIAAGPGYAFHLDLIPRVDLGANLSYMDAVFGPLTETFDAGRAIEGLGAAHLSPRQLALMSPWMLAYRATEPAFRAIEGCVQSYLDHWTKLLENGLPATITDDLDPAGLATRDQRNRAALFNPEVDPVWNQIRPLIGDENVARIINLLMGKD